MPLRHGSKQSINNKDAGASQRVASLCPARRLLAAALLALSVVAGVRAQVPSSTPSPLAPLPLDTGTTGLKLMLRRLQTTARLLQTIAHPDDEDGGMLTLESRGKGMTVTLMTLTRGEGGQNKVGSNLFDVLGVLRTLELTASDRYYGVEQRFSSVADFGFSKNADETFQKWHDHDIALADMVRVIRTFRPDVLVARFSGTERDGHGHHQASAILTKEAFRAAADPKRFPEQIKEGLEPWQAKKLYIGNVCPFFANTCADGNYTLTMNTGKVDPLLGMGYIQFAMQGLRYQLSQGAGGWKIDPGDRFAFYKLVDSTLPSTTDKAGHERDFFDGIDTSLPGLASRLGGDEAKVSFLRPALVKITGEISQAADAAEKDPSGAAGPLLQALHYLGSVAERVERSNVSQLAKDDLVQRLKEKQVQAEEALNLALGLSLQATALLPQADSEASKADEAPTAISPGQKFAVTVKFHNGSKYALRIHRVALAGIPSVSDAETGPVPPGGEHSLLFQLQVPANAEFTRPYWHRDDPEHESINTIDDPRYATLPFPPSPFLATVKYSIADDQFPDPELKKFQVQESASILMRAPDGKGATQTLPLAVVPVFSVMLEPGEQVVPLENGHARIVKVEVACNLTGTPPGRLHLELPPGWRAEPSAAPVKLDHRGSNQDFEFKVFPASLKEGRAEIRAVLEAGGAKYSEGYSLVTREDLNSFYYYQPAIQGVSIVDVTVPKNLKIGYIMGAGDDIPTVLQQVGLDITEISADKLAGEDLRRFGTIVLGIRAYDSQKDVIANNKKLLDFVSAGGTLVVQYNTGTGDFNSGHFTPFPAQLSRARVSVEEAPVDILAPEDGVFHFPNQITQRDFDGWVQERGLYFMDQWDSSFKPLLACHDPGEPPQEGGLLQAKYGKGTYIYTGYAFFRQLPAGVPGAVRLFVNLLSAGHEDGR